MADMTVKRTEDFEPTFGGGMLKARAGLGVTSFGMQVLRFPPHETRHPEHDHAGDGQEEVYTALEGAVTLTAGGEEHRLEPGVFARVGPGQARRIVTDAEPVRILAVGGKPGAVYQAPAVTEEGQPDPMG
jgi:quercetin dioxygenase-like cupin family protein